MKKIAFVLITVLLFGVGTIKAQDQLLSDSEPIRLFLLLLVL